MVLFYVGKTNVWIIFQASSMVKVWNSNKLFLLVNSLLEIQKKSYKIIPKRWQKHDFFPHFENIIISFFI